MKDMTEWETEVHSFSHNKHQVIDCELFVPKVILTQNNIKTLTA